MEKKEEEREYKKKKLNVEWKHTQQMIEKGENSFLKKNQSHLWEPNV